MPPLKDEKGETTPTFRAKRSDDTPLVAEPVKEIVRDEIFARFDKPAGFEQHHFNLVMVFIIPHIFAMYGLYRLFSGNGSWGSFILFEIPYAYCGGLGITAGAHRFWTHKSYKANLPVQVFLMCCNTIALQYPIWKWCLDHRLHHKYLDTHADPHNSKRGFWYSHMFWLLLPKHKEYSQKFKSFDMTDLEKDPVVRFQARYYWTLAVIFHFLVPYYITSSIWGLTFWESAVQSYLRYFLSCHFTFTVNSVAHIWGCRPFDKNVSAVDSTIVSIMAAGEGWHNFHHTFPWDYKAAELGWKFNLSTFVIDMFASIGWTWDLKTVSLKMVEDRVRRTGDGSRLQTEKADDNVTKRTQTHDLLTPNIWGWDDDKLPEELRELTETILPNGK